ncbi:hypothetical protein FPRO03_10973 [Fusarium proliferatum]|uniref:Uncharacterized protein n=1 Tax=Gibberella intermedia TaxID=948311 RepID=A0A365N5R1_GIBIN|nr:hypothetical protein FPRO03_10973 [Fusarium proliferatum]RBA16076.1 hypothetical protein FPRO05_11926 [Fusarium proliferatum]
MAEILGVAASATQLGVACFSLIDVMRKIKGGASTLKRYHEQLQELQSISTSISENPLLQTPEIGTQTDALLFIINNNCLNSLLRKGRVLRTWGFLYREQDLLDIFVRLERQKSNLSLAIEQIQSKALYQIQTDIQVMSEKRPLNYSSSRSSSETIAGPLVSRESTKTTHPPSVPRIPPDLESLYLYGRYVQSFLSPTMAANPFPNQHPYSHTKASTGSPDDQSASQPEQPSDHADGYSMGTHYINAVAGPGYDQFNGDLFQGDGKLSQEIEKNRPVRSNTTPKFHKGPRKYGPGNQYNGGKYEFEGDPTGATVPDMNGYVFMNPLTAPYPSADPGDVRYGAQYNGHVISQKRVEDPEKQD